MGWPEATPGGATHVPVTAHVTSKLTFDLFTELDTTVAAPANSTHLVIANASGQDIGPMTSTLTPPVGTGVTGIFSRSSDLAFGVPTCSDGMTLLAGAQCQWVVTYTNGSGAGDSNANLVLDAGAVHASASFRGFGKP